jgi:hypothetical protein
VTTLKAAKARLLKYALAKPDATLEHPWGENVAKVRGKVFVFFGMAEPAADAPYADYVMGVKLTNALLFAKSQSYVEALGLSEEAERRSADGHVRGVDRRELCERRAEAQDRV